MPSTMSLDLAEPAERMKAGEAVVGSGVVHWGPDDPGGDCVDPDAT